MNSTERETTAAKPDESGLPRGRRGSGTPRVRLGAVLAVAAAIGVVVWLLARGNGGNAPTTQKSNVAALSEQGLKTLAGALNSPIYWAGPRRGRTYELTQTPSGRFYVRYLPVSVPAGTSKRYPFVATFPFQNGFAATQSVANRPDSVQIPVGSNAVAFYSRSSPTNVYLAFRGSNYQIEIFDPNPKRARQVVALGRIEPVLPNAQGGTSGSTVVAASLARLKGLPAELGHPLYWAGAQAGATYELTQTANGRVFVRYLPAGATIGTNTQYLFVGTFAVPNAFKATQAVADRPDSVKIPVGNGVAFYPRSSPTNVYLAFPGSNFQIEVFDPDPRQARTLVRSGQIRPIS